MLLSTKARAQGGSLTTSIPAEVARRLGVSAGTDLFWVEDGQGGYRVYPGGDKTRRLLEAHEEAISEYRDVFRELAR
ncbi:MAG TPA: AbrB/MazE/SpoVT family DNA-binding domain-containing protein [Thermomicrobiales bacterium]|nr:AbrB/MazE/SpoVT family DNA-binding domain-containing protein [Thermomicrobiales bacterium]